MNNIKIRPRTPEKHQEQHHHSSRRYMAALVCFLSIHCVPQQILLLLPSPPPRLIVNLFYSLGRAGHNNNNFLKYDKQNCTGGLLPLLAPILVPILLDLHSKLVMLREVFCHVWNSMLALLVRVSFLSKAGSSKSVYLAQIFLPRYTY